MTPSDTIKPHNGWTLMWDDYYDSNDCHSIWYEAHHSELGHRILQVSRFSFSMTQDRFNWFVDNDFPSPPNHGPWSNDEIDERMTDASSS